MDLALETLVLGARVLSKLLLAIALELVPDVLNVVVNCAGGEAASAAALGNVALELALLAAGASVGVDFLVERGRGVQARRQSGVGVGVKDAFGHGGVVAQSVGTQVLESTVHLRRVRRRHAVVETARRTGGGHGRQKLPVALVKAIGHV